MQYSILGRNPETNRSQQPWYGVAYTPPDIVETLRSTRGYDSQGSKPQETLATQERSNGSYAVRAKNGGKFHRGNFRVHPEQNGTFTLDRDRFSSLKGSPFSCPDLRATRFHDPETVDSVSVDYEPIPKKGHYRIMKRENKLADFRGSKAFQGNSQTSRRGESAPRFNKGRKSNPSSNRLYASPSTIMSPDIGSRAFNHENKPRPRGYASADSEIHCNHCNARLKHRVPKKKRVDSEPESGNISFQQFLLRILAGDSQRSAPMPRSEEPGDFLTPMLLHSAYSNKIPNASSQLLLNILAESFALYMPDGDLVNFAPRERRRRMSYTRSFVNIVAKAAGDLKVRPNLTPEAARLREFPALPRVESKRFRSIYTNS